MVVTIFWPTILAVFAYLARKYSLAWKMLLAVAMAPLVVWLMKFLVKGDIQPGLIAIFLFLAGLSPVTSLLGILAARSRGISSTSGIIGNDNCVGFDSLTYNFVLALFAWIGLLDE